MASVKKLKERDISCPRCWVGTMQTEIDVFGPDITIDICPHCQGSWLDNGELNKLLKDRKLADYLTKDIGTKSKSELVCPRCGGLMDIEKADDVEVDVCLDCHGVWLDSGELEALKGKAKEGYSGDPDEKFMERWEERTLKNRNSVLQKFLRKLTR